MDWGNINLFVVIFQSLPFPLHHEQIHAKAPQKYPLNTSFKNITSTKDPNHGHLIFTLADLCCSRTHHFWHTRAKHAACHDPRHSLWPAPHLAHIVGRGVRCVGYSVHVDEWFGCNFKSLRAIVCSGEMGWCCVLNLFGHSDVAHQPLVDEQQSRRNACGEHSNTLNHCSISHRYGGGHVQPKSHFIWLGLFPSVHQRRCTFAATSRYSTHNICNH